ncbi:MAG TPA: efflux transporter outer membrane subunit [Bryobacteraceae bacterium]|nr:efflux transporter outer membrane subunit [Bryobacteraceae bacterium]
MPREQTIASRLATIAAMAVVAFSASCTIGPKYVKPSAPVPPAYKEVGASNVSGDWKLARPSDDAARGRWWERFNDPRLNQLEEKLNISNQNIVAAAANVQAARAMIREARAQYFPSLTVNPGIANSRLSTGFGKPLGIVYSAYSLPFDATWEPDLWGRIRKTVQSNTLAAQASVADLENVRLSAQSELAADYYELRSQDALKQLLDSTVSAYQEALELSRDLSKAGIGNDEAVAQDETQLKATEAQDTDLGVLRAQYEHAIALLSGQTASEFALPAEVLKTSPPPIPLGVPSELLERRPDIAAAERAVAQANAQIGIAKTAFFPAVTLSASAGLQSLSIAKWLEWPSRMWSVGPTLAQTIFEGGLRKATVQQFQATYDQTVANYRETVLTAFQQVEDNLAALRILAQVIEQQDSAIESAGRSLEEAEVRYKAGIDPYLNVIAAQTTLLNSQQTAVNFRTQQMVASVQLIKALGGGWEASQIPSPQDLGKRPPSGDSAH